MFSKGIIAGLAMQTKAIELDIMKNPTPEKLRAFALHVILINAMNQLNEGNDDLESFLASATEALADTVVTAGYKDSNHNATELGESIMRDLETHLEELDAQEENTVNNFPDEALRAFLDSLTQEEEK